MKRILFSFITRLAIRYLNGCIFIAKDELGRVMTEGDDMDRKVAHERFKALQILGAALRSVERVRREEPARRKISEIQKAFPHLRREHV